MIKHCSCVNEYQDEKYGKGNRVHNECKGATKDKHVYRCTVCSNEKH